MERGISILLIDRSSITSTRMIEWLSNLEWVDQVYHTPELGGDAAILNDHALQLVILSNHSSKPELTALALECGRYNCAVMLFSVYLHDSYREWCMSIGIEYLFDTFSQTAAVEEIIKKIYTSMKDEYCEI